MPICDLYFAEYGNEVAENITNTFNKAAYLTYESYKMYYKYRVTLLLCIHKLEYCLDSSFMLSSNIVQYSHCQ